MILTKQSSDINTNFRTVKSCCDSCLLLGNWLPQEKWWKSWPLKEQVRM